MSKTGNVRKSLESWCLKNDSELLKEWHPTRNLPSTPSTVGIGSKTKYWWLGKCGHEWDTTIQVRMRGNGCPVCSNLRVLAGFNDLGTAHPEIARQWHPILNGDIHPENVIGGSERKVWWICDSGHAYEASLNSRTSGQGCPYCAGKRALVGFNDLQSQYPELASQWHSTRNGSLRPIDVLCGSSKKVWWVCDKGHEWEAVVSSRVIGNNCPYCGNQRLLRGFNDLATVRPDWAQQWHPTLNGGLRPCDVFPSTGRKVWWICENGHEWEASPNNRSKVDSCPYCSEHRVSEGKNDLVTLRPDLATQWHPTRNQPLKPEQFKPGSIRKVWWMCSKGHEWECSIINRSMGVECPYCSGRRVIPGESDLETVFPELALEWHPTRNDPLRPSDVKPSYAHKVWWMCSKGHEWEATVSDRSRSRGCPYCAMGRQASYNEKAILVCLKKTFPDIDFESNYTKLRKSGISELDIYVPSLRIGIEYDGPRHTNYERDNRKSAACRDQKITFFRIKEHLRGGNEDKFDDVFVWVSDHALDDEINEVIQRLENEIAAVAGIETWESHADMFRYRSEINELLIVHPDRRLDLTFPEVAKEWHPTKNGTLLPSDVYAGSNRKVWWMCSKGHEWQAVISSRSKNGCPYCSNRCVSIGENDLLTNYPELSAEWHPTKNGDLKPENVVSGSYIRVWWKCSKGHEWEARIQDRTRGRGCPYCKRKRVLAGFNDLQTVNPELAAEWHPTKNGDLRPSDVMPSTARMVWWKCSKGHEWQATINSRNKNGCPYCSGHRVIAGENDLATVKPRMVKEWHPTKNGNLRPDMVLPDSHTEVWWLCRYGHEWKKQPHGRGKCPYCSGKIKDEKTRQTLLTFERWEY